MTNKINTLIRLQNFILLVNLHNDLLLKCMNIKNTSGSVFLPDFFSQNIKNLMISKSFNIAYTFVKLFLKIF